VRYIDSHGESAMTREYAVRIERWAERDGGYLAIVRDLPGCVFDGAGSSVEAGPGGDRFLD
jgi:hypothetical protein